MHAPEDEAAKISPQTKAVMPVHLVEWPYDMKHLIEVTKSQGKI